MEFINTTIPDIVIFKTKVFKDNRGFFFESFNQLIFNKIVNKTVAFVQDNQSVSHRGVLRGLHYQLPPFDQGKLVRCVAGKIFDVAVDIRKSSPTFSHWVGTYLSAKNKFQIWIPEGFAHGFLVLSRKATLIYKTTNYYHFPLERTLKFNDSQININWPNNINFILSEKDSSAKNLMNISDKELFE